MIADASLSNAFDDLADLFLGDAVSQTPPSARSQPAPSGPIDHPDPRVPDRPVAVEGLVLGHLPMMGSLWASQYVRMAAAAENGPVALVRLDHGTARVELFGPTCSHVPSRASCVGDGGASDPERQLTELGTALARARRLARRIVVFSSLPADELLLAGSSAVRSMSLLTGADDASAVGAYKALKRLGHSADAGGAPRSVLFRVAVMGSDEQRATAAFHRLAEAARSFLALPIELAGHCRQIAGGVPG
ncbi:MAG: hypothetical protein K2X91_09045, partial [Thermoleophilia bacterium]|nr:hypothetical protein [Thermoleophilia bacterium]